MCNESREIFRGNVMHNHEADSETCLNRQILNNSIKRKAMEDLCERPCKLIHEELLSQDLGTLTYKDIRNISRNRHKARSSQMLPLPTDIEETHKALSAVQVQTSSKGQLLLVNDSEKNYCNVFLQNQLNSFLAPLMCFTLTWHSNQHQIFSPTIYNSWTQKWSLCATCIFLTGQ
jgi:hypothetical protein